MKSLITLIYGDLLNPGQYFQDGTILTPKNTEVHELNSTILNKVSGIKNNCLGVDTVSDREFEYIPLEVLSLSHLNSLLICWS